MSNKTATKKSRRRDLTKTRNRADNIAGDSGEENSDDGGHDNTISAGHSTVADESRGQLLDSTLKKAIEKQIAHSLRSSSLIKRLADDVYDVIAAKLEEQVVDKVYKAVNLDLKKYMDEVETMKKKMSEMKKETKMLQDENEEAEQYSRRNCLRLYGIPEGPEEKTDELILDVFNSKLGLTVPPDAIDRSHRISPRPRQGDEQRHESSSYATASRRTQPRPIIVKFSRYNIRNDVYKARTKLKNANGPKIWLKEDLTARRANLFWELVNSKKSKSCWTQDGIIFAIRSRDSKKIRIRSRLDFENLEDS
ncbi:uncharacterized protein LOC121429175 [Lytechinus variegatus]|uniref:uncharacterized protein LOC121429175 n=1 Tax=Lytechinus variegatus TaxID=7654 RepID=UPI001BB1ED69|nr:uncharacterized protein LOC121429175 [Lytechinus variegatus]